MVEPNHLVVVEVPKVLVADMVVVVVDRLVALVAPVDMAAVDLV